MPAVGFHLLTKGREVATFGAGGAREEKQQAGSRGSSSEVSLSVLNPGVLAPLQSCSAELNYRRGRLRGREGNTGAALGEEGSGS